MNDWKQDLDAFFRAQGKVLRPSTNGLLVRRNEEARMFIAQMVIPAFEELQAALKQYGREILLSTNHTGRAAASIRVRNAGRDEFEYIIAGTRSRPSGRSPMSRWFRILGGPGAPAKG